MVTTRCHSCAHLTGPGPTFYNEKYGDGIRVHVVKSEDEGMCLMCGAMNSYPPGAYSVSDDELTGNDTWKKDSRYKNRYKKR